MTVRYVVLCLLIKIFQICTNIPDCNLVSTTIIFFHIQYKSIENYLQRIVAFKFRWILLAISLHFKVLAIYSKYELYFKSFINSKQTHFNVIFSGWKLRFIELKTHQKKIVFIFWQNKVFFLHIVIHSSIDNQIRIFELKFCQRCLITTSIVWGFGRTVIATLDFFMFRKELLKVISRSNVWRTQQSADPDRISKIWFAGNIAKHCKNDMFDVRIAKIDYSGYMRTRRSLSAPTFVNRRILSISWQQDSNRLTTIDRHTRDAP